MSTMNPATPGQLPVSCPLAGLQSMEATLAAAIGAATAAIDHTAQGDLTASLDRLEGAAIAAQQRLAEAMQRMAGIVQGLVSSVAQQAAEITATFAPPQLPQEPRDVTPEEMQAAKEEFDAGLARLREEREAMVTSDAEEESRAMAAHAAIYAKQQETLAAANPSFSSHEMTDKQDGEVSEKSAIIAAPESESQLGFFGPIEAQEVQSQGEPAAEPEPAPTPAKKSRAKRK